MNTAVEAATKTSVFNEGSLNPWADALVGRSSARDYYSRPISRHMELVFSQNHTRYAAPDCQDTVYLYSSPAGLPSCLLRTELDVQNC